MRPVRQTATCFRSLFFLCSLVFAGAPGYAQPSGGPYGPIDQRYEIPKAAHVYYVAPDGKAGSPGTTLEQPTTIEAAIERVVTGDAIVMRGGVYRTGGLVLNQGITLQPYAGERPILKGTQVATKWEALRNNVWRTAWTRLFPAAPQGWWRRDREGMRTPLHRFNNDMVFVDGEMLKSAGWEGELDAHSFYIDYEDGYVYIGVDPTNRLVEITAFDSALVRTSGAAHGKTNDHKGPVIRGITFTQYAYRALEVEGKKQLHRRRRAHRRARRPGGSRHLRQGGHRHDARERDHHLLLARGRLLPRRRPRHPELARQRHQHGRHLRHRLVRRPAGEEHLPAEQHRADHRLLPGRGEDLQPDLPRHLPRQPGHRSALLERHLVRRRQPRRRVREQLDRGGARRLLLRDLARGDRGGQCLRPLRQGRPRAELRGRARVQQHLRGHARRPSSATSGARRATTSAGIPPPARTWTSARATCS